MLLYFIKPRNSMNTTNQLNVYSGEDSLKKYYDPDYQPPLPLVEIPACLNPYRKDGVRIYAKMMTVLPANNVKALPGRYLGWLGQGEEC